MVQYIDKDALVAEINRLIAELVEKGEGTMFEQGRISTFEDAKLFLDTLEVKEVDLEKKLDSMKSPEESLGIDSDTYNKIVDECVYGEQKPTEWSEEDEKQARQIERIVHNGCTQKLQKQIADWFKALKKRVQPKKEWGDEDNERIEQICEDLKCGLINFKAGRVVKGLHFEEIIESNIDYLKALKNKYTWKPSEEQINTLEQWLKDNQYKGDARYCYPIFDSLYQDLKKLKKQ